MSDSELDQDMEMVRLAMSGQPEESGILNLFDDDILASSSDPSCSDVSDGDTSASDEEEYECDFLPDRRQRKQFKFRNRRVLDATAESEMNDRKFKSLFRMSRAIFEILFQMIIRGRHMMQLKVCIFS